MKKSNDDRHVWCKFVDIHGVPRLGFTCGTYKQVLMTAEAQTERHVTAECYGCGSKAVKFDAGLLGWRRCLLPTLPFIVNSTPRRHTYEWSGITDFTAMTD